MRKDDSVRALGVAYIASDRPTRDKLHEVARRDGLALSEFLRKIANDATSGQQGALPVVSPGPKPDSSKRIEVMASQALEMAKLMHWSEVKQMALVSAMNKAVKFNGLSIAQTLFDKVEVEFEDARVRADAKEHGQLELRESVA